MKIPLFYVDAFTSEVFRGNPAAVCLLESWLPDEVLQSIAAEHNLSETAFVVKSKENFQIKWFTPKTEVNLCGHATLASAYVLFKIYNFGAKPIHFESKSGILSVTQNSEGLVTLDFPKHHIVPLTDLGNLAEKLQLLIDEAYVYNSDHLVLVLEKEDDVKNYVPDFGAFHSSGFNRVMITAPGKQCDFVYRYFAPAAGVNEDPVTGSAQCTLAPYWSNKLIKKTLSSVQLSERGGELWTEVKPERVLISGNAVVYMQGTIQISIKQQNILIPFNEAAKK